MDKTCEKYISNAKKLVSKVKKGDTDCFDEYMLALKCLVDAKDACNSLKILNELLQVTNRFVSDEIWEEIIFPLKNSIKKVSHYLVKELYYREFDDCPFVDNFLHSVFEFTEKIKKIDGRRYFKYYAGPLSKMTYLLLSRVKTTQALSTRKNSDFLRLIEEQTDEAIKTLYLWAMERTKSRNIEKTTEEYITDLLQAFTFREKYFFNRSKQVSSWGSEVILTILRLFLSNGKTIASNRVLRFVFKVLTEEGFIALIEACPFEACNSLFVTIKQVKTTADPETNYYWFLLYLTLSINLDQDIGKEIVHELLILVKSSKKDISEKELYFLFLKKAEKVLLKKSGGTDDLTKENLDLILSIAFQLALKKLEKDKLIQRFNENNEVIVSGTSDNELMKQVLDLLEKEMEATLSSIKKAFPGYSLYRVQKILKDLEDKGLVLVDRQIGETLYYPATVSVNEYLERHASNGKNNPVEE